MQPRKGTRTNDFYPFLPPAPQDTDESGDVDTGAWSRWCLDHGGNVYGLTPSVTSSVRREPFRRMVISTVSPGRRASTALCSATAEVTFSPSNARTTSP